MIGRRGAIIRQGRSRSGSFLWDLGGLHPESWDFGARSRFRRLSALGWSGIVVGSGAIGWSVVFSWCTGLRVVATGVFREILAGRGEGQLVDVWVERR